MPICKTPICPRFNKQLSEDEIVSFGAKRVCSECLHPVDDDLAEPTSGPTVEPARMPPPLPTADEWRVVTPDKGPHAVQLTAELVDDHGGDSIAPEPLFASPTVEATPDVWDGQPAPGAPPGSDLAPWDGFEAQAEPEIGPVFGLPGEAQLDGSASTDGEIPDAHFVVSGCATGFPEIVVYQDKVQRGPNYVINGDIFTIGRSSQNSEVCPDLDFRDFVHGHKVSRRHARIIQRDGRYFVEDLGSKAGTWVDEEFVEPGMLYPLEDGVIISIGGVADLEFLTEP